MVNGSWLMAHGSSVAGSLARAPRPSRGGWMAWERLTLINFELSVHYWPPMSKIMQTIGIIVSSFRTYLPGSARLQAPGAGLAPLAMSHQPSAMNQEPLIIV